MGWLALKSLLPFQAKSVVAFCTKLMSGLEAFLLPHKFANSCAVYAVVYALKSV